MKKRIQFKNVNTVEVQKTFTYRKLIQIEENIQKGTIENVYKKWKYILNILKIQPMKLKMSLIKNKKQKDAIDT